MYTTSFSKLMAWLLPAAFCLGLCACSDDKDAPATEDHFTTEYTFDVEFSEDLLATADVTATILFPEGTLYEETISQTNNSFTLKGNSIPDRAGILFLFDAKEGNFSGDYEIGYKVKTTISCLNNDKVISSKLETSDEMFNVPAENLSLFYGTSLVLAGEVSAHGEANVVNGADFDFGLNTTPPPSFGNGEEMIDGHAAVMMREASDDSRALYFADCNIGASAPEETGLYFWWGDVEGHPAGDHFDFAIRNSVIDTQGKTLDQLRRAGFTDDNDNLVPEKDAATQKLGGSWRMPTKADLEWLISTDNCTWEWQPYPEGYKVKSLTTGGEIFLPAAGVVQMSLQFHVGKYGEYWSATAYDSETRAHDLAFGETYHTVGIFSYRFSGFPIRAVAEK